MALVNNQQVEADGWAEAGEGLPGNGPFVDVGIGFSSIPMRVTATLELTRFVLLAHEPPLRDP